MADRPEIEMLFSAATIQARVEALAETIARELGPSPMIVAVLKGGFVFTADLLRALHYRDCHPRIDFLSLSSYGAGSESRGTVTVQRDITDDPTGQTVLLVDDILESGRTLSHAKQMLLDRGAVRVDLCVLLEKPGKRKAVIEADYVGFECADRFVVGYGLDYAHLYRELPYIGAITLD